MASTGANRSGPYAADKLYLVYGYTSATDFTGVAVKCLQGGSTVTVASQEGVKIGAGEKFDMHFQGAGLYLSCQTGSGTGVVDVCLKE